jgi:hypothetical protein
LAIDLTLASATLSGATRTNSTISKPASTVDGDFLLSCLYTEADIAVTLPSGWTLITNADSPGSRAIDLHIAYKRASGEGANWTWTHASGFTAGFVQRMTGVVASGDPQDATLSQNNGTGSGATTTINWTTITTATANSAVCGIAAHWNNGTLSAETLTERVNSGNVVLIADIQAAAGATGGESGSWNSNDDYLAVLLALKEETGGGGATNAVVLRSLMTMGMGR